MNTTQTRRGKTQKIKKAVHKNCHSRMFLSGIFNACCNQMRKKALFNKCVEDPRLQASGMTPLFNNGLTARGFTLIELLVVVLIIGILAAVALPQYNKVVKKAQGRELLMVLPALEKAVQAYYLETGRTTHYTDSREDYAEHLPIQIPDLKYWIYVRDGAPYTGFGENGSSHFYGFHISTYGGSKNHIVFGLKKNPSSDFYVDTVWEKGKLQTVQCYGKLASPSCAEYFDCPAVQPSIQVLCGEEVLSYAHSCILK